MKKTLLVVMGVLYVMLLTGCNTVQGMGKDIKNAGNAIENAANR